MVLDDTKPPVIDPAEAALFLDFDGTLVDLAPRPDAVSVPEGLSELLDRLHQAAGGAVALVSGRALDTLEGYLPRFPGAMVGSHGAERRGAPAAPMPEGLSALQAALHEAGGAEGLLVEIKTRGGALHFREAPEREAAARTTAEELAERFPAFAVQPAKMAFELKPRDATKAAALRALAAEAPFAGRRPVYLGDDSTDEPALDWALSRGGIAVKVGGGASVAPWRIADPAGVRDWLAALTGRGN